MSADTMEQRVTLQILLGQVVITRFSRAATVAAVVLGLLIAPAAATADWLPAVDVSAGGEFGSKQEPQIAVGSPGEAIAVWPQLQGEYKVQASSKFAGGGWGAPVDVSSPDENAVNPQVAMNAAGQAVAVWVDQWPSPNVVMAARRSPAGAWGPAEALSSPGASSARLDVAIDPEGRAVAAWSQSGSGIGVIEAATSSPDGSWELPVKLSAPGHNAWEPKLAVDSTGHIAAVWYRFNDSGNAIVQVAEKDVGSSWGEPQDLSSPGANAVFPDVSSSNGRTVVVWKRQQAVEAATKEPGGAWQAPVELAEPYSGDPAIGMDATGNALAIWTSHFETGSVARISSLTVGGTWSAPMTIAEFLAEEEAQTQIAVNLTGQAMAIWGSRDGGGGVVEAASGTVEGVWDKPVVISSSGARSARVGIDSEGSAAVVWRAAEPRRFQAALFDAVTPQLTALIPGQARAGREVSFAVSPSTSWSPAGPVTWSFGDMSTATGLNVTHSFQEAGQYQVTVQATDAVGESTTASGVINVAPALAVSSRVVTVKRGKAHLRLRCDGTARCHGSVMLTRTLGKKVGGRSLTIAKVALSIPGERAATVTTGLSKQARHLLAATSKRRLRARLTGDAVKSRDVILKLVPTPTHRH